MAVCLKAAERRKRRRTPQKPAERRKNTTERSLTVNYQGPTVYISDRNDVVSTSSFIYEFN